MEINNQIRERLMKLKIAYPDGLSYLLAVYFKCTQAEHFEASFKAKMISAGIFEIKGSDTIWTVSLFRDQEINFEWVKEFRLKFKEKNRARAGSLSSCTTRMKEFFAKNPHVRKEDVMRATDLYIASVNDYQYITVSQHFIFKDKGVNKTSPLEDWIEDVFEEKDTDLVGVNRLIV